MEQEKISIGISYWAESEYLAQKRPVSAAEMERLVGEIESALQAMGRAEVSSRVVGDMVIAGLKELDQVAYIRYAIVYLGLDDLLSIRDEIDHLLEA